MLNSKFLTDRLFNKYLNDFLAGVGVHSDEVNALGDPGQGQGIEKSVCVGAKDAPSRNVHEPDVSAVGSGGDVQKTSPDHRIRIDGYHGPVIRVAYQPDG